MLCLGWWRWLGSNCGGRSLLYWGSGLHYRGRCGSGHRNNGLLLLLLRGRGRLLLLLLLRRGRGNFLLLLWW